MKLQEGDRVRLTREGEDTLPMQKVKTGKIEGVSGQTLNILVDGEERPSRFHRDFWEKQP